MSKFVLVPDSFKGTLPALRVCEIMEQEILRAFPRAEVLSIPVADGGEGSVECFLRACGGRKLRKRVTGPFPSEKTEASYAILRDGETAVIEMAAAAGLPLAKVPDPAATTTFGVGELILDAAENGAKNILVGLGGSATNDGGCGAAHAAGVRFFRKNGEPFLPTGGNLKDISYIDCSHLASVLQSVNITAICDVDNPLCGKRGAAFVFGPQKGADTALVQELDEGLSHLDRCIRQQTGQSFCDIPGAGAGGGMGAGMMFFFKAKLQMGIETVLDTVHFDRLIQNAEMILTGEGCLDSQSLRGKVVSGVARRARTAGIPVVAIVGDIKDGVEPFYQMGVCGIFSTNRRAVPFALAKPYAERNLAWTMGNLMHFYKTQKQRTERSYTHV